MTTVKLTVVTVISIQNELSFMEQEHTHVNIKKFLFQGEIFLIQLRNKIHLDDLVLKMVTRNRKCVTRRKHLIHECVPNNSSTSSDMLRK